MSEDLTELVDCPFCGSEVGSYHNHVKNVAYVECGECGAHGPLEEDPKVAEQRWNARADDNRWRSVAEQAEKALRDVMPDWFDEKLDQDEPDGNAAMEISYGNVRAIAKALAAFDSLRKEATGE